MPYFIKRKKYISGYSNKNIFRCHICRFFYWHGKKITSDFILLVILKNFCSQIICIITSHPDHQKFSKRKIDIHKIHYFPIFHYGTHIEKYDSSVEGAATMINREMARMLEGEYEFINREDDLGLEGLRFAKMSYYPSLLLDKISALHLTPEQRQMRQIWHDVFGDEISEIDSFLIRHNDATPLIHKEEGDVVSMLFVVPLEMWGKRVAYIYAVATKPEYRGRGIASKLLREALQMVERSGDFDLAALIPSSTESKRLYLRLGFEDTQMEMHFPTNDYLGTGSVPHDIAMTLKTKKTKA